MTTAESGRKPKLIGEILAALGDDSAGEQDVSRAPRFKILQHELELMSCNGLHALALAVDHQMKVIRSEVYRSHAPASEVRAWMTMTYQCEVCGHIETVYLEEGLESWLRIEHQGQDHVPVPFLIPCDRCSGQALKPMRHIMFEWDKVLRPSRPVPAGARYFRMPNEAERKRYSDRACGVPCRMPAQPTEVG